MTKELNDKSIWDEIYQKTDCKPGWDSPGVDRNLLEMIVKHHNPEGPLRMLDAGCGNGRNSPLAEALEEHSGQKVHYLGVDFAESAVEFCKSTYPSGEFACQDMCADLKDSVFTIAKSPITIKTYDLIVDCGCFHAIPPEKREDYKKNIAALIGTGGLFIIGAWYRSQEKEKQDPQYFPFLYLSEWFFNETDIDEFWQDEFSLMDWRIDTSIYNEMFDGFAYFALRRI